MRLFLAIDIPEALREELKPVLDMLRTPGIKPVAPENLHVTVKFLGDVNNQAALEERLESLKIAPFSVRTTDIGCFGYRVLWLGLESPGLQALGGEVDRLLGADYKSEPYSPHLTLARGKDNQAKGPFHRFLGHHFHHRWTAERLVLYESVLGPEGAKYRTIGKF